MTVWPNVELGELVELPSGQVDPKRAEYRRLPHIGSDAIKSGTGQLLALSTAADLGLTSGKYVFSAGDVLLSKIRPALNKVAIPNVDGICSADIYPIRVDAQRLDAGFLAHWLRSPSFLAYALKHSARSSIPKLNRRAVLSHRMPLPPLDEQRRIAAVLDRLARIGAGRAAASNSLDVLTMAVFHDLIGDPWTNPRSWTCRLAKTLLTARPQIGTTRPATMTGAIPVVRIGELGREVPRLDACGRVDIDEAELEALRLAEGDLLLTRAVGSESHLGKASVCPEYGAPVVFDSHVMRLRLDVASIRPMFLWHWLRSTGGRRRFMRIARRTSIQFNVNADGVRRLEMPVPPISTQDEFLSIARRIDAVRVASARAAEVVGQLQEDLSCRAFRGEL